MSAGKYNNTTFSYEDYEGIVDGYENGFFWGHIKGLDEPEYFHAKRLEWLESAFQVAVREHIFMCVQKKLWGIDEP